MQLLEDHIITLGDNTAKYYVATSNYERKTKAETLIEVERPDFPTLQFYADKFTNDRHWEDIQTIDFCVRHYLKIRNNKQIVDFVIDTGNRLNDWLKLLVGFRFRILGQRYIAFYPSQGNCHFSQIPNSFRDYFQTTNVDSVYIGNSEDNKCYFNGIGNGKEDLTIEAPKFLNRTLYDMLIFKLGHWYYGSHDDIHEPLIFFAKVSSTMTAELYCEYESFMCEYTPSTIY